MTIKLAQSDEAVFKATGKYWEEWRTILDDLGMADQDHIMINITLGMQFKLSDWWAAAVATGYERMIGRRQKYQRADGYFFGSASKTIHAPYDLVWQVISTPGGWLEPAIIVLRTYADSSLRFDEIDRGQVMSFWLTDKDDRVGVRAIGEKFLTAEDALAWKEIWKNRLEKLKTYIEGNTWYVVDNPIDGDLRR